MRSSRKLIVAPALFLFAGGPTTTPNPADVNALKAQVASQIFDIQPDSVLFETGVLPIQQNLNQIVGPRNWSVAMSDLFDTLALRPNLASTLNGTMIMHGTTSSVFAYAGAGGQPLQIVPLGQLESLGRVPYSGEIMYGRGAENAGAISAVFPDEAGIDLVTSKYTQSLSPDLAGRVSASRAGWTPEVGIRNLRTATTLYLDSLPSDFLEQPDGSWKTVRDMVRESAYYDAQTGTLKAIPDFVARRTADQNFDAFRAQNAIEMENQRLQTWSTLSAEQQQLIMDADPVVIGIRTDRAGSLLPNVAGGDSSEILLRGGTQGDEIVAVWTVESRIGQYSELVNRGRTTPIPVYSIDRLVQDTPTTADLTIFSDVQARLAAGQDPVPILDGLKSSGSIPAELPEPPPPVPSSTTVAEQTALLEERGLPATSDLLGDTVVRNVRSGVTVEGMTAELRSTVGGAAANLVTDTVVTAIQDPNIMQGLYDIWSTNRWSQSVPLNAIGDLISAAWQAEKRKLTADPAQAGLIMMGPFGIGGQIANQQDRAAAEDEARRRMLQADYFQATRDGDQTQKTILFDQAMNWADSTNQVVIANLQAANPDEVVQVTSPQLRDLNAVQQAADTAIQAAIGSDAMEQALQNYLASGGLLENPETVDNDSALNRGTAQAAAALGEVLTNPDSSLSEANIGDDPDLAALRMVGESTYNTLIDNPYIQDQVDQRAVNLMLDATDRIDVAPGVAVDQFEWSGLDPVFSNAYPSYLEMQQGAADAIGGGADPAMAASGIYRFMDSGDADPDAPIASSAATDPNAQLSSELEMMMDFFW